MRFDLTLYLYCVLPANPSFYRVEGALLLSISTHFPTFWKDPSSSWSGTQSLSSSWEQHPQAPSLSGTFGFEPLRPTAPCLWLVLRTLSHAAIPSAPLHVTLPRHTGYLAAGPWFHTACTLLLSWAVFKRTSSFQDKIGFLFWVVRLVPGARRGKNMSSYVSFGPHSSLSQVAFCTQMSSFIFMANFEHVSYSPFCVLKTSFQYTITHITLK